MNELILALSSLSKGLEVLKTIREIDKNFDSASYKAKIAELIGSIADAKIALVNANDEISKLNSEIERLNDLITFKVEHTIKQKGLVFEVYEDKSISYLAFCPKCILQRTFGKVLQQLSPAEATCSNCGTFYSASSLRYEKLAP